MHTQKLENTPGFKKLDQEEIAEIIGNVHGLSGEMREWLKELANLTDQPGD